MQSIAYFTHPACQAHEIAPGHPEQPARISAVDAALRGDPEISARLEARSPTPAHPDDLQLAHSREHVERLLGLQPAAGEYLRLDADTAMNAGSRQAALRAAGAVIGAVDTVLGDSITRAFCNVRPPGHHAERGRAMGFCLFNNIAIGARHAIRRHGLERVALADFDVHFGNGSSDILGDDEQILLLSSCQYPLYPLAGMPAARRAEINLYLEPGSDGQAFRDQARTHWLPALRDFQPQLLLISAGFDAHRADPLADLRWQAADYAWITSQLIQAHPCPVVSSLEGGYDLAALAESARAHVQALCGATDG